MWPFKKKEGYLNLPNLDSSEEPTSSSEPNPNLGFDQNDSFLPSTPSLGSSSTDNSELKVISAKLDTINAKLENLSQRLANIEKIAAESQQPAQPKQWYKV